MATPLVDYAQYGTVVASRTILAPPTDFGPHLLIALPDGADVLDANGTRVNARTIVINLNTPDDENGFVAYNFEGAADGDVFANQAQVAAQGMNEIAISGGNAANFRLLLTNGGRFYQLTVFYFV